MFLFSSSASKTHVLCGDWSRSWKFCNRTSTPYWRSLPRKELVFCVNCGSMLARVLCYLAKWNCLKHLLILQEVLHCKERDTLLFWASMSHLVWHILGSMSLTCCPGLSWWPKILDDSSSRHWLLMKWRCRLHSLVSWTPCWRVQCCMTYALILLWQWTRIVMEQGWSWPSPICLLATLLLERCPHR